MTLLRGDGIPLSRGGLTGYRMVPQRYTGHVLYCMLETQADLRQWLPEPLAIVDPNLLFLKLYSLKRRNDGQDYGPAGYWQYHEAVVATLATFEDGEPGHYNLFMWVDRDWAMWKAREVIGWPKKLAQIDLTHLEPGNEGWDLDRDSPVVRCLVSRYGYPLLEVDSRLGEGPPVELPPARRFYGLRRIPAPLGGRELAEVTEIETTEGWASEPVFGTAQVKLHDAPDEELALFEPVEVKGCALRQVQWLLPANPARVVAQAPSFEEVSRA